MPARRSKIATQLHMNAAIVGYARPWLESRGIDEGRIMKGKGFTYAAYSNPDPYDLQFNCCVLLDGAGKDAAQEWSGFSGPKTMVGSDPSLEDLATCADVDWSRTFSDPFPHLAEAMSFRLSNRTKF